MGPDAVAEDVIGFGDESEAIGGLLDGNFGVGAEGEFEDAAEDVGEAAEALVVGGGEAEEGVGFG